MMVSPLKFKSYKKEREQATRELQAIANIENAYKDLGKFFYKLWDNREDVKIYAPINIMSSIIEKLGLITKLEEAKNGNS
jgi:hypothetical protein